MNSNGASQSLLVTTLASAFVLFSAASGDAELELASGLAVFTGIGCMDWRSINQSPSRGYYVLEAAHRLLFLATYAAYAYR